MIRQDYFMRMVQRLAQALAQALFHKQRQEFQQAEQELNAALEECFGLGVELPDLEQIIALCAAEGGGDSMVRLAEVFAERGEIHRALGRSADAAPNDALALGLFLEVLHSGMVSIDLIQKTESLIEWTTGTRLPAAVLKRLLRYYEARGMLGRAEDVLYEWFDTKDPLAPEGGLDFYRRASRQSDDELSRSGLSRPEVEQGLADWRERTKNI
jgi:hypothetical protein